MGSARLARFVWPGMILVGLALGAAVWATWPGQETRVVRLPYGEAQPKAAGAGESQRSKAAPRRPDSEPGDVLVEPASEPARVLAGVEPSSSTEEVDESAGPSPIPSDLELSGDYEQESPEELGAEPLPGAELTQSPPAAG